MTDFRTIAVDAEFALAADTLWRTVSDFTHIDRWTDLKVLAIEGEGIGCRRTVEMPSGLHVTERLVESDAARRIFSYEVVEPNPYPMHDYRSTMVIEAIAPQRCRLHWSGRYLPLPEGDPTKTDNLLRKVYGAGVDLLRKHLEPAVPQ